MEISEEYRAKLVAELDAKFMEALFGGPQPKPRQTALRARGNGFETVELDDAGNIIEPVRCICGHSAVIHRSKCPFFCMVT
jgi:hypothetical protein